MNKPDVNGRIIRWLLLLQQFDLTVIDKRGKENVVSYFLSRLTLPTYNEEMVDDKIPYEHIFSISVLSPWISNIANYLVSWRFPSNLSSKEKRNNLRKHSPFNQIGGKLFIYGPDHILRRRVRKEQVFQILSTCHMDLVGVILLLREEPLNFYRLITIGPLYIKMQGETPRYVISATGRKSPHPRMKCPCNLKWFQSHLKSGACVSLGQLTYNRDIEISTSLCALIT